VKFLATLKNQELKKTTRKMYYNRILRFFKWYKPKLDLKVKFPKSTKEGSLKKDWENQLPTLEEIELILQKTDHPRDRAFFSLIAESGARINEVLRMQYNDVLVNEGYLRVTLRGRTKERDIPIMWAAKYMIVWLDCHPSKKGPLWSLLKGKGYLSYKGAYGLIKRLAKNAGIEKNLHPHLYRHWRATLFGKDPRLTTELKKIYLGHSKKSRTFETTYEHTSQEDMFEEILQNQGLTQTHKEEYTSPLKTELCPRCNTFVAKEDKFCSNCWFVLDEEEALKQQEAQKKPMEMINKILEFLTKKLGPEGLEDLFKELQ